MKELLFDPKGAERVEFWTLFRTVWAQTEARETEGWLVAGKKGASSVTYEIDTRPDASLEPFQRAERANKGTTGKATTTLMEKDGNALLSFSGQTATGVKLEGSVTCRKVV